MMDWLLWLAMIPLAWFMWWVGFIATRRMRVEKNAQREVIFSRMRVDKAGKETSEQAKS
jgi:hypothetical protein